MKMLDQTDIDSLLAAGGSATGANEEPVASSGNAADDTGMIDVPAEFRLAADERQLDRIRSLEVPAVVRLAERRMDLHSVLQLSVGSIIEFDKHADADLDLVISNVPVGTGNAVKCGEKFGLRVIKIEPWIRRRIADGTFR